MVSVDAVASTYPTRVSVRYETSTDASGMPRRRLSGWGWLRRNRPNHCWLRLSSSLLRLYLQAEQAECLGACLRRQFTGTPNPETGGSGNIE